MSNHNLPSSPRQSNAAPWDGLHGRARSWAMVVILGGLILTVLDSTMLNLALPQLARQWRIDPAHTLWVVNANQIAVLVLLLPLAALGDRLGYQRVYLWGMLIFGVSAVMAMFAPSLPWLIAARALQGMAMAGVLSVNGALVRQIYPRSLLGQGLAVNSMVVALSTVMGPVVAAAVLSWVEWRWLFALHLPISLALWAMGRHTLPPAQASAQGGRLSWLDVALNVAMFGGLFLALDRISHFTPGSSLAVLWLCLALGLGAGVWYVLRQRSQTQPMLPLDLLRIPVFALSMGASVSAFCAQTMAFLALPFLLIETYGLHTGEAGLLISAWPLALALVAPWAGRQIGRIPAARMGCMGMVLFATGLWSLALLGAAPTTWDVVWRLALCGAGFALFQSPNNHTIVTTAPVHRSGAASGMLGTARHVGQGLGALLLAGAFLLWPGSSGQAEGRALWLAGGSALLAACFSVLRKTPAAVRT